MKALALYSLKYALKGHLIAFKKTFFPCASRKCYFTDRRDKTLDRRDSESCKRGRNPEVRTSKECAFNSSILEGTALLQEAREVVKSWRRSRTKLSVRQENYPSLDQNYSKNRKKRQVKTWMCFWQKS